MLKKLRVKFILVNMAFVVSILLSVLSVQYFSNVSKHNRNSHMVMEQAVSRPYDSGKDAGKNRAGAWRRSPGALPPPSPLLVVRLDADGKVTDIYENHVTLSVDEDTAQELSDLVRASGRGEGALKDYSLRYLTKTVEGEERIIFLDQSYELNMMKNLAVNSTATFCFGTLLFFFLSLFLSHWALKPVKEAWERQNQFIADASHELKTPLTVILANLQILSAHREATIASQEKWLSNTKEEASRMKLLVEDLLFLARSDSGVERSIRSDMDLSDAVSGYALLFESVAFEQKVTLDSDIEPDIHLIGDEWQIRQLVGILLDNACKYTPKGGQVELSLKRTANHIILKVHNTGEMIPEQEQEHIFERFYRPDKSRARQVGGYGLGLSIAQTIANRHKGKIAVTSTEKEGTAFTVAWNTKA